MEGHMSTLLFFLIAQFFLIFFHIYQSAFRMKHIYLRQKNEAHYKEQLEHKNRLSSTLESLKDCSVIKAYAEAQGMVPLRLSSVRHIKDLEHHDQSLQSKN
jgi:hypothetical protein